MIYLLLILSYTLSNVCAHIQCSKGSNDLQYIGKDEERPNEFNSTKPFVLKCCAEHEALFNNSNSPITCTDVNTIASNFTLDFSILNIYKHENSSVESNKTFYNNFHLFYNKDFLDERCSTYYPYGVFWEDGTMSDDEMELLPLDYCMDLLLVRNESGYDSEPKTVFYYFDDTTMDSFEYFTLISVLVSIVFLILTAIVLCVLGQFHKMVEKLTLTYVLMLLTSFILKVVVWSIIENIVVEFPLTCFMCSIYYYAEMSGYFWLNITSLDVWWSLRGLRLQRQIHHRGIRSKYLRYGTYAWGVPFVITSILVIVNNTTEVEIFNDCFHGYAHMEYLYVPLSTLILMNCALFVMTLYNIWRVRNAPEIRNSPVTRAQKTRFINFTKLSLIMGVPWILEAIMELFPAMNNDNEAVYYAFNGCNSLIGVVIFFTFACNKSNYKQFCKRYNIKSKYNVTQESTVTTLLSSQKSNSINLYKIEEGNGDSEKRASGEHRTPSVEETATGTI